MKRKRDPGILTRLFVNTLSVFIAGFLLRGVYVESLGTALIVSVILAILNVTVKPFLILITFPITVLSLGLFLIVINVIVFRIASGLINGFYIDGFFWALLYSVVVSIVNSVLTEMSK